MDPLPRTTRSTPADATGSRPGLFRLDLATDTWWWSHETYRIHGFEPGEVVPTTALVLAHKHPEDRARFAAVLAEARRTGEPFASMHRIMAATGHERLVALVGYGPDTGGRPAELRGMVVDLSRAVAGAATAQIASSAAHRATIEQAKGILVLLLGVPPQAAFEALRATSMDVNLPVRDLAGRLVERAGDGRLTDRADLTRFLASLNAAR